jgi:hypothetical protein
VKSGMFMNECIDSVMVHIHVCFDVLLASSLLTIQGLVGLSGTQSVGRHEVSYKRTIRELVVFKCFVKAVLTKIQSLCYDGVIVTCYDQVT